MVLRVIHNLGYAGRCSFGLNTQDSVTMAMQVGIRNGGLVAGLAYDVLHSSNVVLASVVFGTVQNASGALVAAFVRKRQERTSENL